MTLQELVHALSQELYAIHESLNPSEHTNVRAIFDRSFDAKYGPNSTVGPPGVAYRFNVPCRVVPQLQISQDEFPANMTFAWVTYEGAPLNFPVITLIANPVYQINYGEGDVITIPSGGVTTYTVLRAENVHPPGRPPYHRCLVCTTAEFPGPLPPPPPPCPIPGVSCDSAPTLALGHQYNCDGPGVGDTWWYEWDIGLGTINHVTVSSSDPGNTQWFIYTGDDCGGLVFVSNFIGDGCATVTPGHTKVWMIVRSSGPEITTIHYRCEGGPC